MGDVVVRTEVIENDKDGTLEKVYFEKERRIVDEATGETREVQPWEIRAKGRKVQELRGTFKDSAPEMLHEGFNEWKSIGEEKITRPDGSVDTVRADKVEQYRRQPGFCVSATRPTFTLDVPWEGSMKRLGIRRQKVTKHYTETWYHDGRHTLEEYHG